MAKEKAKKIIKNIKLHVLLEWKNFDLLEKF